MSNPERPPNEMSEQAETRQRAEAGVADVQSGALYVAHGAVTARALAGALAARDPRRRTYLRHVVLMATLLVVVVAVVLIAAETLFG